MKTPAMSHRRLGAFRWGRAFLAAVAGIVVMAMGSGTAFAATCSDWTYRLPTTQYQVSPAQFTGSTTTFQTVPVYNWSPQYTSTRTVTSTYQVPVYEWRQVPSTSTTYEYRITGYTQTPVVSYTSVPVYRSVPVYSSYYYIHVNDFRWGSDWCISYVKPANCGYHSAGWLSHWTSDRMRDYLYSRDEFVRWDTVASTTYTSTPVYSWVPVTSTTYTWEQVQTGTRSETVSSTESQVTSYYPSSPWTVTNVSQTSVYAGTQQVPVTTTAIVGQYVIASNGAMSLSGSTSGTKSWGAAQWVNSLPTGSFTDGNQYQNSGTTRQVEIGSSTTYSLLNSPTAPPAPAFSVTSSNPRTCVVRPS